MIYYYYNVRLNTKTNDNQVNVHNNCIGRHRRSALIAFVRTVSSLLPRLRSTHLHIQTSRFVIARTKSSSHQPAASIWFEFTHRNVHNVDSIRFSYSTGSEARRLRARCVYAKRSELKGEKKRIFENSSTFLSSVFVNLTSVGLFLRGDGITTKIKIKFSRSFAH